METDWFEWLLREQYWIELVQSQRTRLLDLYFRIITFLGDEEFYLLAVPAIYWLYDKRLGRRLIYLLILSTTFASFLKNTFRLSRPPEMLHLVEDVGFGLPSAHAMNSVSLWAYAAWGRRRTSVWLWAVVVFVIVSIAFSRIYLGVHYPTDAIVGMLLGIPTLWLFIWSERRLALWLPYADRRWLIPGTTIVSLIILFVHPGDEFHYPAELAVSLAGLFWGVTVGSFYEVEKVRFVVSGTKKQRLLRYLVGIVLSILVWLGLRLLFDLVDVLYAVESVLRFVRYAFTGLVIVWLAPWLFVRLGLAEQAVNPSGD